jgi:dCMP deaminase
VFPLLSEWDRRFLDLARHVGKWSKDQSRQVGCVIVGPSREIRAIGYNGFPRGADDSPDSLRNSRPNKYLWTEHAERNAIYQAARVGITVSGCTMYLPWFPCMDCARAIVQVGISRLIALQPDVSEETWGEQFLAAKELLDEASVEIQWA